ncbi:MAG: hypothetical protein ACM33B_08885 [Pseudomonadota bacterium]
MARPRKDILTRLADAGEEAIARFTDAPGADRMLGAVTSMRDRMDELQRRVRGIDELERRVAELERRLDALAPAKATPSRSSASKARSSAAKQKPASKTPAKGSARRTGPESPG